MRRISLEQLKTVLKDLPDNPRVVVSGNFAMPKAPLHPEVKKEMIAAMEMFGNPSSMHAYGREARANVENARWCPIDLRG